MIVDTSLPMDGFGMIDTTKVPLGDMLQLIHTFIEDFKNTTSAENIAEQLNSVSHNDPEAIRCIYSQISDLF